MMSGCGSAFISMRNCGQVLDNLDDHAGCAVKRNFVSCRGYNSGPYDNIAIRRMTKSKGAKAATSGPRSVTVRGWPLREAGANLNVLAKSHPASIDGDCRSIVKLLLDPGNLNRLNRGKHVDRPPRGLGIGGPDCRPFQSRARSGWAAGAQALVYRERAFTGTGGATDSNGGRKRATHAGLRAVGGAPRRWTAAGKFARNLR